MPAHMQHIQNIRTHQGQPIILILFVHLVHLVCATAYEHITLLHDRSGKIAIWPYIMRELPLSPVEALRLENRFRGRQRSGSATTAARKTAAAAKIAEKRNGVVYYPACLADDNSNVHNNSNGKLPQHEQEGGPRQHAGPDLDAPRSTLDLDTRIVRSELPSQSAWGTQEKAPDSHASPDRPAYGIMCTKSLPLLRCDRRRPSSSGARRRPRQLPSQASLLDRSAMDDYAECPSGCGEEIRVQDLQEHHKSLCSSR